ncbi:hypothetical protein MKQ70_06355 [Chitinophaga sedimenti]|uniref:hypothetical protein n=1 Tax=Chitinophaga sedimenti TaxID=2033606 RepID=UPI002003B532|nr:hypothetical protein [Chitinophaga sedimenti]MCK7554645.1 hypothetical protein [Chitinophaga sedimenti]
MQTDHLLFGGGYFPVRTARQRKRTAKKHFEKKIIKLRKEPIKIARLRKELPMGRLAKPRQEGWKRTWILYPDTKGTWWGYGYEQVLKNFNTEEYSDNKEFDAGYPRKSGKGLTQQLAAIEHYKRQHFVTPFINKKKNRPQQRRNRYPFKHKQLQQIIADARHEFGC